MTPSHHGRVAPGHPLRRSAVAPPARLVARRRGHARARHRRVDRDLLGHRRDDAAAAALSGSRAAGHGQSGRDDARWPGLARDRVDGGHAHVAEVRRRVLAWSPGTAARFAGASSKAPSRQRIEVAHFTEDYLPMHGVTPLIGRNFTRDDTDPGRAAGRAARLRLLEEPLQRPRGRRRPDGPIRHRGRDDRRRAAGVVQRDDAGRDCRCASRWRSTRAAAPAACPCTRACART